MPVFDDGVIGKSAEGLEIVDIGLAAAKDQRRNHVQREQVPPWG